MPGLSSNHSYEPNALTYSTLLRQGPVKGDAMNMLRNNQCIGIGTKNTRGLIQNSWFEWSDDLKWATRCCGKKPAVHRHGAKQHLSPRVGISQCDKGRELMKMAALVMVVDGECEKR